MKKIINKSLSTYLQLTIFIFFTIFSISIILTSNIIKHSYINSIENNAFKKINNVDDFNYQSLIEYYNKGIYIYNLDENDPYTIVTIDNNDFKAIITANLQIGDTINYRVDNGILLLNGDNAGVITNISYPNNINFLLNSFSFIENKPSFSEISAITNDNNSQYAYVYKDNYLIIAPIVLESTLFTNLNLYIAIILLICFLLLFILGYFLNYHLIYPITEMTEVTRGFKENKYSHQELNYYTKDYKNLANEINDIGLLLENNNKELQAKKTEVENYIKKSNQDYKFNKQLVANISHEIKTPLAIIQATICAIQDGIFDENEQKNELNNVLLEIDKTNKMLQEIVSLYKMENDSFKLNITSFNLDEMLKNKLQEFEKIALKYDQTLIYKGVDSLYIKADITQIDRIINNIILNAITYSPPKNKITIETRKTNHYSVLEIINYGINIKNEDLNRIFEPFYRVDKSRNKSEDHGNGLGLYYVKQMLEKHNFDFGMENVINGVRFYIIFDETKPKI